MEKLDKVEPDVATMVAGIERDFIKGGPYVHQVIRYGLMDLAKVDKCAADTLYLSLCKRGY